jgi:hypothetical protein
LIPDDPLLAPVPIDLPKGIVHTMSRLPLVHDGEWLWIAMQEQVFLPKPAIGHLTTLHLVLIHKPTRRFAGQCEIALQERDVVGMMIAEDKLFPIMGGLLTEQQGRMAYIDKASLIEQARAQLKKASP